MSFNKTVLGCCCLLRRGSVRQQKNEERTVVPLTREKEAHLPIVSTKKLPVT